MLNITEHVPNRQSRVTQKRSDRHRRQTYTLSRKVETNDSSLQLSPSRRVTRASVAWTNDRDLENSRLRHIRVRSRHRLERKSINLVSPQQKKHSHNSNAVTHTTPGYIKSNSRITKSKILEPTCLLRTENVRVNSSH